MSITKIDVLNYMKEQVINGYVRTNYVSHSETGCHYCVVGHGLKMLGFTDEQLLKLNCEDGGSASIAVIMDEDEDVQRKEFLKENQVGISNEIREKFLSINFTKEELEILQSKNDGAGQNTLLKELDGLIKSTRSCSDETCG